jgi:hypothetical protein
MLDDQPRTNNAMITVNWLCFVIDAARYSCNASQAAFCAGGLIEERFDAKPHAVFSFVNYLTVTVIECAVISLLPAASSP